jgi:hypothetical protein
MNLGGSVAGDPSPVYNPATGHLEIYIRGAGSSLYQKYWSPSGGWSGWNDLGGGSLTGSPDALFNPASGNLEVYTLTTGHTVWEAYWVPATGWHNGNLGGSLAGL